MAASRSLRLRQDGVFEVRVVGDPGVLGRDPANRGVQILEQLIGDAGGDLRAVAETARVLVNHEDPIRPPHAAPDGFPVVGREGAEVQDFHGNAVPGRFPGGEFGAMDERAESDERQVLAGPHGARLPEGNHEVGSGIGALVVGLPVQMLVLEEDDRILATDRGAEQPCGIECSGGLAPPAAPGDG